MRTCVTVSLFFVLFGFCTLCLSEGINRPEVSVGTVSTDVRLDGSLTQSEWSGVSGIERLTMVEPKQGGTPSAQTIVKVLANSKEIIFGIWCKDPDPRRIVSFSKERDADLTRQDHIKIVLDGFQDGRSGYVFAVNP